MTASSAIAEAVGAALPTTLLLFPITLLAMRATGLVRMRAWRWAAAFACALLATAAVQLLVGYGEGTAVLRLLVMPIFASAVSLLHFSRPKPPAKPPD